MSPLCKRGLGGFKFRVLKYKANLKSRAQRLRKEMTDSERMLWSRLRGKQILEVQFYRQKSIGNYIVDFYASKAKIVIEVDGSQHMNEDHEERDKKRDMYLKNQGLKVLRFDNLEVLREVDSVMDVIYTTVEGRL